MITGQCWNENERDRFKVHYLLNVKVFGKMAVYTCSLFYKASVLVTEPICDRKE